MIQDSAWYWMNAFSCLLSFILETTVDYIWEVYNPGCTPESPVELSEQTLKPKPHSWTVRLSVGRIRHLVYKNLPRWVWCAARVKNHSSSLGCVRKTTDPMVNTYFLAQVTVKGHNSNCMSHVFISKQMGNLLTETGEQAEEKRWLFPSFPVSPLQKKIIITRD